MLRCPHCDRVDDEIDKRGYCIHCGEDVSAARAGGVTPDRRATGVLVRCPECGRPSDSVKCYRMGVIVFLVLAWFSSTKNEFGCPRCIRGKIAGFCLTNLLTANVIWPLLILPWSIILLLCSLSRGHSREVRKSLR
jgi:hypothetical protein